MKEVMVTKASGEEVVFSMEKLRQSLRNSGATEEQVEKVIKAIEPQLFNGISTKKIYNWAFSILKKSTDSVAAKYQLKKAITEFGPSGFPFERFIGKLFERKGYHVKVGVVEQGTCVSHELDVVASSDTEHMMMECKFHSMQGKMSDVKVPLYIHSRFNDVKSQWLLNKQLKDKQLKVWVVTNTRFSPDAVRYATCAGLNLLSWDYPLNESIKVMIDRYKHYPITCLTLLTKSEKEHLLENNVVLCSELKEDYARLNALHIPEKRIQQIKKELEKLIM
jgi:Holliday junction resolvase